MFTSSRALLRTLERERDAFARERAQLIDTICVLAGRQLAPTDADVWRQQVEDARAERVRYEAEREADLVDYEQLP